MAWNYGHEEIERLQVTTWRKENIDMGASADGGKVVDEVASTRTSDAHWRARRGTQYVAGERRRRGGQQNSCRGADPYSVWRPYRVR